MNLEKTGNSDNNNYSLADDMFENAEKLVMDKDYHGSANVLKKALSLNANYSFAYILLSKVLLKLHRNNDALKTLETCSSSDPSYAYPYYLMAKIHYASGNFEESLKMLETAKKIDRKSRLYARAVRAIRSFPAS